MQKKVQAQRMIARQYIDRSYVPTEVVAYEMSKLVEMWATEAGRHDPSGIPQLPTLSWEPLSGDLVVARLESVIEVDG